MPALNYTVFIDKVASGEKCQTIRAMRKRPFKVGDVLSHYTGMRTKKCRKIRPDTICTGADEIIMQQGVGEFRVIVKGKILGSPAVHTLARADGFEGTWDFYEFFALTHGLPFTGQIIKWEAPHE